jgi:pimeloyl-ACP methyl ester carboxylesterase
MQWRGLRGPMATTRTIAVNGIEMAVTEEGTGPLVILCHGWPELSFSWRYQIPALAAAGYRVAAPDMRGFGGTSAPADIGAFSLFDNVGDIVALVGALGETRAAIVGHDWGAPVAWHCAMFRPDLFPVVAALSVPIGRRARMKPLEALKAGGIDWFYWHYFQEQGVAEAEFERDVDRTMRLVLYGRGLSLTLKPGGTFLEGGTIPDTMPAWLDEAALAHMVEAYRKSGFRGGLNWYRNIDRNWAITAPWQDAKIMQPALFMAGAKDGVILGPIGAKSLAEMEKMVPNLRRKIVLEKTGHWIQQERPQEVNAELIAFLGAEYRGTGR